jgi:hypothetical protein
LREEEVLFLRLLLGPRKHIFGMERRVLVR